MSQRWLRHNIIGNEVHRPRPIAYLHGGWARRRRRPLRRAWGNLAVVLVLALIAGMAILAGHPGP